MPIDVQCPQCGKRLKAPDAQIGKQAKCPQCQNVFVLQPASGGAVADQWHVRTGEGDQYGPVSKAELDTWVAEGRLDAVCQVRSEGSTTWRNAGEVYPELAVPNATVGTQANRPDPEPFPALNIPSPLTTPATPRPAATAAGGSANPFSSPQSQYFAAEHGSDEVGVTPATRQALKETKPWVTLFAVLGFIGSFGMVFAAFGMFFVIGWFSLVYVLLAVAYVAGSYYLLSYGRRIGDYLSSGTALALERAILAQKSFWRLAGIITAVFIVLWIGGVVLGLAGAVFM